MVQETHKPGLFKKPNKPHKTGRHRSKGAIAKSSKGRESVKSISKHAKKELGKEARRHQLQQLRANKREEVLKKKRSFGGAQNPPILIVIVPLQEDVSPEKIVELLISADEEAIITNSSCATHISLPRFKQRFSIIIPPHGNTFATLDAVKIANTVLFVASAVNSINKIPKEEILDLWGEEIIQLVISQGLPTPIVALTDLESLPIKKRQEYKQNAQKTLIKWLPEEKIMTLNNNADALNILRRAGSQKQRNVNFRNKRSFLLGEDVKFTLDENNSTNDFGTLAISGYLQGMPLSVNGLVHIPGFGDYQMSRIEECKDPFPLRQEKVKSGQDVEMDEQTKVVAVADPEAQESLESENTPDPMDAEQTWPTDEELALAEKRQARTYVKRVPKGTSAYQAAWIVDDEDEDNYSDEEDDEDEMSVDDAKSVENSDGEEADDKEDYETITISETTDEQRYDDKIDFEEEKRAIVKFKEAVQDSQFPDEIDTPIDVPAKERFQKYRGLESFRNTVWDKKENLPFDYGRIFQFENFDRTKRRIFRQREELINVQPGAYVTIYIEKVSKELFEAYRVMDQPLIVFGILENEHKMSVLNFLLKRTSNNQNPIKSKERVVFQCGYRRFTACPIFSEHTNGNKYKFERFFQPGTFAVASCFAPIMFPPSPVLCWLEKSDGHLELIATGNLLSVNPDRIVLKRVVLSGHPFKVHKKSAVIRFMFFNSEDIRWFRPVKLRTKYGCKGHIKESLGTHGHMKCIFDRQLKSEDTILMNLYKRVFPKWTYEPVLLTDSSSKEPTDVKME